MHIYSACIICKHNLKDIAIQHYSFIYLKVETVTYICTLIIFFGENCITLDSDDMMKYNM